MKKYLFLLLLCITSQLNAQEISTNNWYVGNTKFGEWIQYRQVWLSAGHYRFTTKAVAKDENQTVRLELNNNALQANVRVPSNTGNDFELVHLGSKSLPTGYYDVKLVFETGNVNCDMIFIKKDNNTAGTVLDTDTLFTINRNDGPHIFAIGGVINASCELAKPGEKDDNSSWHPRLDRNGAPYSRKQMLSWNKQEIYAYYSLITDQAMDIYVSEQVEAKVDVIFAHGRGDDDLTSDIEDRSYKKGIGGYGCRLLRKLVEAINRSVYAKDNLKLAYFLDNAAVFLAYKEAYKAQGKKFDWGELESQEFMWNYAIKQWYENVPRDMLFLTEDNRVPIQFWTANAEYDYNTQSNKIVEFLTYIRTKMRETFQLEPAFILSKDFFSRDSRVDNSIAWGVQAWFAWNNVTNRISMETFDGKKFAFAFNGGRMPMAERMDRDWDPETNTGTWLQPGKAEDFHVSALNPDGTPRIRPIFEQAIAENAEWVVLESWSDWPEGSTFYRSDHPEYRFPNQYMALVREFADRDSESIVLEAEGCDEYYTTSTGNRGGAYRMNWYNDLDKDFWSSDKEINLSIYRPLHKLGTLVFQGKPATYKDVPLVDFAAGQKDVWGFIDGGLIYAHEIDGHPANKWSARLGSSENVKKLSLGGSYVWALTKDNRVLRSELATGATNTYAGWVNITRDLSAVKDIDISLKDTWAVDAGGNVYYSDLAGKFPWKPVPGKLSSICADDQCAWGFTMDTNELVRISSEKRDRWDTIPNPYNLVKISAASGEVWGVNAENKVYRKNSSPDGEWQFVFAGYTHVAVGYEYVWLMDTKGDFYNCKISGFETASVFPKFDNSPNAIDTKYFTDGNIRVSPTKFSDYVQIDILTNIPTDVTINIYNINGMLLKTELSALHPGANLVKITNLGSLKSGMYILTVTSNRNSRSFRIIK
jgi:hypothetical protein